ncbi:MAG: ABC transporter permease [Chloroflexota bacterium]|nr:ABC transporter permease [Chloroflexota bacterium]
MNAILDTWYLFIRNLRNSVRLPIIWVMSLIQPLIWLLLFGQLFKNIANVPGFPTESYLAFLAPGIMVMTALFGATFSGMGTLVDMDLGYLDKMLVTPVNRNAIILGRMGGDVLRVVIQTIIIVLIALAMGVGFATGFAGFITAVALVALMVIGFAGLSNILALRIREHQGFMMVVNFITLPVMFMSSALMPRELLPNWLQTVAHYNPVTYAADGIRSLMTTGFDSILLVQAFLVLGGVALVMMTTATLLFRRRLI